MVLGSDRVVRAAMLFREVIPPRTSDRNRIQGSRISHSGKLRSRLRQHAGLSPRSKTTSSVSPLASYRQRWMHGSNPARIPAASCLGTLGTAFSLRSSLIVAQIGRRTFLAITPAPPVSGMEWRLDRFVRHPFSPHRFKGKNHNTSRLVASICKNAPASKHWCPSP